MGRLGERAVFVIAGLILLMLVAGAAAAFGPGRGLREDVSEQREITGDMLSTMQRQIRVMESQLSEIEATRTETARAADLAERTLAIVERQLQLIEHQVGTSDEVLRLQRRLVEIAEQTLREAREINRKTPPAGAAATTTTTTSRR